jgi:hypothetical protein
VVSSCRHGNELLVSIKGGEFLESSFVTMSLSRSSIFISLTAHFKKTHMKNGHFY